MWDKQKDQHMTDHSVDVVVSGGGIAGMVTAIAFAQAGFDPVR